MLSRSSNVSLRSRAAWLLLLPLAVSANCAESDDLPAATAPATASTPVADEPVAAQRTALLDLAFEAVTKMPMMPHVKDRSRAQEAVVDTCLELDLPQRAARYIPAIENWRRGTAYADLADWCAERGAAAEARKYLALADEVAQTPDESLPEAESPQSWRRDRIRARIARTHLRLGESEQAAAFEAGLAGAELGTVASARAQQAGPEDCDAQLEAFERSAATADFDEIEGWLPAAVELYGRFHADEARRSRLEELFERVGRQIPRGVRIGLTMDLAEQALARQDLARASELLQQARTLTDEAQWDLDDLMPLTARLVVLRSRAGDVEGARTELETTVSRFEERRAELSSIRLARALRPLAEAHAGLGDEAAALALYGRAIELGADNPNARPRAEELSATCCSMARHGVEPGPALAARLAQLVAALDSPW